MKAKVIQDLGNEVRDYSAGLKHRTKFAKNAAMVSSRRCHAYFQKVVVQTKEGAMIIKIPLTPKIGKKSMGSGVEKKFFYLDGRREIGETIYMSKKDIQV